MRFLCLHGASTSGEIFEIQSGGLVQALESQGHSFHFVNGRLNAECEPELQGIVPPPFYSHYPRDVNPGTDLAAAIQYTLRTMEREGPFDGVMGFSQGAALAYSLLENHVATKGPDAEPLFKVAVFICAGTPYALDGSGPVELESLRGVDGGREYKVRIPTAHIVGKQDRLYEQGLKLFGLCEPGMAEVYDHGGKHMIPFDAANNDAMVGIIERAIGRVKRE
ncbi:hypothetical protein BDW74DRAFT_178721 [Aspergillus multicolor]|uniref:uncharacterized protein n=1 Tax=Aspergillus multicolor TaxID=41759 RepID=UPI003CCE4947